MAPGKMITLETDGQPVTVVVEREQLENELTEDGYPADRSVYVTTWNDHQIDDTPIGPMAAVCPERWRRLPRISGTSGSRSPTAGPG
jgi:hypothetical protein